MEWRVYRGIAMNDIEFTVYDCVNEHLPLSF